MVKDTTTDLKVSLVYEKGSFTYSHINHAANNEQLYELAAALNSLQDKTPEKIVMIHEIELVDEFE